MTSIITLVGRASVGKTTLFRRLMSLPIKRTQQEGSTRDRIHAELNLSGQTYQLVDTGGWPDDKTHPLSVHIHEQIQQAIKQTSLVCWVVNTRDALRPDDVYLNQALRRSGKPLCLIINNLAQWEEHECIAEFSALGISDLLVVNALSGEGLQELRIHLSSYEGLVSVDVQEVDDTLRLAVLGRPNVGKSTLVNHLLGDERVITADYPGTTTDNVATTFQLGEQKIEIVDTAGFKFKRQQVLADQRQFMKQSLQSAKLAQIVLLLLEAKLGLCDQDLKLIYHFIKEGKPVCIAINQWDTLDKSQKQELQATIKHKLEPLGYVPIHYISALYGANIKIMMKSVVKIYHSMQRTFPTSRLTQILLDAVSHSPPAMIRGRRPKLRYAHIGSQQPLKVVVHGSATFHLQSSYIRYLTNVFQKQLDLFGVPVQVVIKEKARSST